VVTHYEHGQSEEIELSQERKIGDKVKQRVKYYTIAPKESISVAPTDCLLTSCK
jgi:hypothetical protein